jgi:hypothetical protein
LLLSGHLDPFPFLAAHLFASSDLLMGDAMKSWEDFLVSWAPMLLFIVVWGYFMRRNPWVSKQNDYYQRRQRHMEKVEELLGRIATALERR